jgi:hypothetical protein
MVTTLRSHYTSGARHDSRHRSITGLSIALDPLTSVRRVSYGLGLLKNYAVRQWLRTNSGTPMTETNLPSSVMLSLLAAIGRRFGHDLLPA